MLDDTKARRNTRMKTLHVHIGTPKTATTAIQHFCKENAKILAEKGFCYPIFPKIPMPITGGFCGQNCLTKTGFGIENRKRLIFGKEWKS